jgi:hypothetical protein
VATQVVAYLLRTVCSSLAMIPVSPEAGEIFFALETQGFVQCAESFLKRRTRSAHYILIPQ